jgi:hypothetical protein
MTFKFCFHNFPRHLLQSRGASLQRVPGEEPVAQIAEGYILNDPEETKLKIRHKINTWKTIIRFFLDIMQDGVNAPCKVLSRLKYPAKI